MGANMSTKATLTGGKVNYYLADVPFPQREDQPAYRAECEDITDALQMTPNEFCEFKAIWRTAAARLDNGKPGHKELYDAEKRVHYAQRDVLKYQRQAGVEPTPPVIFKAERGEPVGFSIDGEKFGLDQWWVAELQHPTTKFEQLRALAVAMRVLRVVLPQQA